MARPLLRSCEIRKKLDCYFSSDERDLIRSRANEAGLSMSSFIRKASLGAPIHVLPSINVEMWQALAHTTANLNQIAHHLNTGTAIGVHPDVIDDLAMQVQQVRLQLMGVSK